MLSTSIAGCLLGTAVGDALGLPFEGLRARPEREVRHRFLFGRGMISDDTEHTCLIANALIASAGEVEHFEREFAGGLRRWLLTIPAGVGFATLRATAKLCLGFGPARSGVHSAGNGPAMRAAMLGVCYGEDPLRLQALVRASTRITHTDERAEHAALAVAMAGHFARMGCEDRDAYWDAYSKAAGGGEFAVALRAAVDNGETTPEFADRVAGKRGPSGFCMESVPVALHAWLRHPADYRAAVSSVICSGGDTDTTAAITGALVGTRVGVPSDWLAGLADWPRGRVWLTRQAELLSRVVESGLPGEPLAVSEGAVLARNLFFAMVVIGHGVGRVFPK